MPAATEKSRFEQAESVYARRIKTAARESFRLLPNVDPEDIEQELREVLFMACNSYDPDRGAKFNTHFWNCAQNKIKDLHKAASCQKRVGDYERISLDVDAVRQVISESFTTDSAEDQVVALHEVREILRRCIEDPG